MDREPRMLCWDCHAPIEDLTAEQVRTNPQLPEWMSSSTTKVCADCALLRMASGGS